MGISDKIEAFILELMKQERDAELKIQRNELAEVFGCVPSQINYVISTRFNPDRGYMVTSRRGGGGYVVIKRLDGNSQFPNEISERDAMMYIKKLYDMSKVTRREAQLMQASLSDMSLYRAESQNVTRADILKNIMKILEEEL